MNFPYNTITIDKIIDTALQEDLSWGDVTTALLTGSKPAPVDGILLAKQDGILAGIELFEKTISRLDPCARFSSSFDDGVSFSRGDELLHFAGRSDAILMAERTALNFLLHMTGIATLTARFVREVQGTSAVIADTRKTLPGLRILEKYAVRCGGGHNHRYCLSDMVLIKENHITLAGGITSAVEKIRRGLAHPLKIEVEVASLEQIAEALECKVDVIMLDNFEDSQVAGAVRIINHSALVEVSGNITPDRVKFLAEAGVDIISAGSLTHSAPSADISLLLKP